MGFQTMKLFVITLATAVLAAGCAQATKAQTDLAKAQVDIANFTQADLDQAILMAGKATDAGAVYRARCYTTLKKYVPAGQTVSQALMPKGVVSGFEAAAEVDAKIRNGAGPGIPADVHADCAVIVTDVEQFAVRIGAIAAGASVGAPGAAGALKTLESVPLPIPLPIK